MKIKIKNEKQFNIRREAGVYSLLCKSNNRLYIGSTKQVFRARFSDHIKFLERGDHGNNMLQYDYNEFGRENFEFEVLKITERNQQSVDFEREFVEKLKPEYNKFIPASNNSYTNQGRKFGKKWVEKIRKASKKFRHENKEIILKQNKEGANKYEVTNIKTNKTIVVNSYKDLQTLTGLDYIRWWIGRTYKKWKIELVKTQRKKISLLINNEWKEFQSYNSVDRFLKMWRGFTSTQLIRQAEQLKGYKVKFNEDNI